MVDCHRLVNGLLDADITCRENSPPFPHPIPVPALPVVEVVAMTTGRGSR